MIFLQVFFLMTGAIGYIAFVFVIGAKIQDWCWRHERGDIFWPWIWSMIMIVALPLALIASIVNP